MTGRGVGRSRCAQCDVVAEIAPTTASFEPGAIATHSLVIGETATIVERVVLKGRVDGEARDVVFRRSELPSAILPAESVLSARHVVARL